MNFRCRRCSRTHTAKNGGRSLLRVCVHGVISLVAPKGCLACSTAPRHPDGDECAVDTPDDDAGGIAVARSPLSPPPSLASLLRASLADYLRHPLHTLAHGRRAPQYQRRIGSLRWRRSTARTVPAAAVTAHSHAHRRVRRQPRHGLLIE